MKNEKKHDSELEQKWNQKRAVYTQFNPPPKPRLDCSVEPSKTDKSQAAACDINNILKTFQRTGVLPGVNKQQMFADVSNSTSYQEALNLVIHAEEQFMSLDAHTRKKFSNDPAEFMEFVHDPKNAPELVKMGLATLTPPTDTDRIVDALKPLKTGSQTPSPADPDPSSPSGRTAKQK